jgi:hypothetical protein
MSGEHEGLRVGIIAAAAVGFLFGVTIVLVNSGGPSEATPTSAQRGAPVAATVGYDLSGLPSDAVLVVERRSGPKADYVEVARSSAASGVLALDASTGGRSLVRYTVLSPDGAVVLRLGAEQ